MAPRPVHTFRLFLVGLAAVLGLWVSAARPTLRAPSPDGRWEVEVSSPGYPVLFLWFLTPGNPTASVDLTLRDRKTGKRQRIASQSTDGYENSVQPERILWTPDSRDFLYLYRQSELSQPAWAQYQVSGGRARAVVPDRRGGETLVQGLKGLNSGDPAVREEARRLQRDLEFWDCIANWPAMLGACFPVAEPSALSSWLETTSSNVFSRSLNPEQAAETVSGMFSGQPGDVSLASKWAEPGLLVVLTVEQGSRARVRPPVCATVSLEVEGPGTSAGGPAPPRTRAILQRAPEGVTARWLRVGGPERAFRPLDRPPGWKTDVRTWRVGRPKDLAGCRDTTRFASLVPWTVFGYSAAPPPGTTLPFALTLELQSGGKTDKRVWFADCTPARPAPELGLLVLLGSSF